MMNAEQFQTITDLLKKRLHTTLTASEGQVLEQWLAAAAESREILAKLEDSSVVAADLKRIYTARNTIKARINAEIEADNSSLTSPVVHRVHFLKTSWFRYAAAIIILIGAGTYYWSEQEEKPVLNAVAPKEIDKMPGGNRAILTLADGSTVLLDSSANGELATQGNTKILKLSEGSLAYSAGTATGEVLLNTISTPRGGQYQIVLPDGSKARLNAASSIKFPTVFNQTREVAITGEVYFEVLPDAKKPFFVKMNEVTSLEVLGTSFNVNTYSDEDVIATTLQDGSLRVLHSNKNVLLKPGEQASISNTGNRAANEIKVENVNVEHAIAWKNGLFSLKGTEMPALMRQLSRWYDIEVEQEVALPKISLGGTISRDVDLGDLLKALNVYGIHYKMENGKLILVP